MTTIMLISDSLELTTEMRQFLFNTEYELLENPGNISDKEFLRLVDVLVIDATRLPGEALALITQLKDAGSFIPFIMIVAPDSIQTAVQAMRAGAMDVLVMPINQQSFLKSLNAGISQYTAFQQDQMIIQQAIALLQTARTKAIFTANAAPKSEAKPLTSPAIQEAVLQFGALTVNLQQEKVFYQKNLLALTPTQFKLLVYLGEARGRVVPFEELYFQLHGVHIARTAARTALSAHLSYLRTKLSEVGCAEYLESVRGRGYLFEVPEKTNPYSSKITLDLILEQLPIILWTTDVEFHITSVFGNELTPSDFLQTNSAGSQFLNAYQKVLTGAATAFEQHFQTHIFQVYLEPYYNDEDTIIGCIGMAVEITERQAKATFY